MKKLKHIGWSVILLLSIAGKGLAQTVAIYFVAPTAAITASFPGAGSTTDMPTGYSFVQLTAANEATFKAMPLPRLQYVYGVLQPGTAVFNLRDKVFNNSDRTADVEYYLVDDRTAFTDRTGKFFIRPNDNDHKLYIWPAAKKQDQGNGRWLGWIGLGEHELNAIQTGPKPPAGGQLAMDEVVLHETSHTQWFGDASKWPATPSGIHISYGADGDHAATELLGDQPLAMNEGLGTFYGLTVNRPGMDDLYANLTTEYYFVENRSVLAGDATLNAAPGRTRYDYKINNVPVLAGGIPVIFWIYKWTQVPDFYLMFSEQTSTAFYSLYWDNAYQTKDTAFSFIGSAAEAMHTDQRTRYLTYACNRISVKMEDYNASPAGQADASRTSSMLPFAILDLVTHFGMTDAEYKADYDRNHPDRQPKAYTEYFTNHRAAIRALVQGDLSASPVGLLSAMAKIKTYCQQPATIF